VPWTCPECKRPFGRKGQSHVCEPGLTIDPEFREIHERVAAILEEMGPVVIEPVEVGIFFKKRGVFVELRPRKSGGWDLTFVLPRRLDHPRITRRTRMSKKGERTSHALVVHSHDDIDDDVQEWLAEAYFEARE
jgi:hypothetical protein